jgi:hypothetical protein
VNVRFACPACDAPDRFDLPGPNPWHCPACGHTVDRPTAPVVGGKIDCCALCGNGELYRQKDFPQWLGMAVLAGACASFFVLAVVFYQYTWAWGVLLGSAAVDGLLYYGIVGDVVMCYRCGCQHRGAASRAFDPFELATGEKYRQERLRREQLGNPG